MKYFISLTIAIVISVTTQAQSGLELVPPDNDFCYNCENGYGIDIGTKMQIGIGVVKEIKPKFDLVSNLGYGYWAYQQTLKNAEGIVLDQFKTTEHLMFLSLGERLHLFKFENSSFYTGVNFNLQLNVDKVVHKARVTIEPSIGWRYTTSRKTEIFIAAGYDQQLNRYIRDQRPGKVTFNLGFNFVLKKKDEHSSEEI